MSIPVFFTQAKLPLLFQYGIELMMLQSDYDLLQDLLKDDITKNSPDNKQMLDLMVKAFQVNCAIPEKNCTPYVEVHFEKGEHPGYSSDF